MREQIQSERRKNDFYKILFDIAQEAIFIIDMENNAMIVDVNKKALELFGYTFEEFTSLSLYEISNNPELTRQRLAEEFAYPAENNYKRKDGTLVPIVAKFSRVMFNERYLAILIVQDLIEQKQKEEALILSEAKYRAIVEDQIELICRFNTEGILTFANEAYCNFFNKKYENLIGKPIEHFLFIENKNVIELVTSETPYIHFDHCFVDVNGETKWIHWSTRLISNSNNTISEYQSIGFDITDRKKLEDELRCSRKKYRAILDNLQDGFYQTDKDGNIIFISNTAVELVGYTDRNDIIGTYIGDYFFYKDGRAKFLKRLKYSGGKLYDQEIYLKNRNGEMLIVSVNSQFIYDENGKEIGTQGTVRDITDHKHRLSEIKRLYNVVEGSQNGLVVIELDGTVTYVNQAAIDIARSPVADENILGRHIKTFISVDAPNTLISIFNIIEKENKWFGPAYVFCACSGQDRIPIDVMFSRIIDDDGKAYIVASFYDTTEYRRLEDKIKQQSKMYEELQHEMSVLVRAMTSFNDRKQEKLSTLEEAFTKSVEDLKIKEVTQ